jgi:hypothetical protein
MVKTNFLPRHFWPLILAPLKSWGPQLFNDVWYLGSLTSWKIGQNPPSYVEVYWTGRLHFDKKKCRSVAGRTHPPQPRTVRPVLWLKKPWFFETMVFQKFIVFSSYDLEKPWFRKTMVFSKPWKQSNLHSLRMQVKTMVFSMVFQNHGLIFILWPAGKLCFFFKSLLSFPRPAARQRDDDGRQARRK